MFCCSSISKMEGDCQARHLVDFHISSVGTAYSGHQFSEPGQCLAVQLS